MGPVSNLARIYGWKNVSNYLRVEFADKILILSIDEPYKYTNNEINELGSDGISVIPVKPCFKIKLFNFLCIIYKSLKILKIIQKKLEIKMVIQMYATPLKHALPIAVAKFLKILNRQTPLVISLHSDYEMRYKKFPLKIMLPLIWKFIFKFTTCVRSVSKDILTPVYKYGFKGKFEVIPNRMDLNFFASKPSQVELENFLKNFKLDFLATSATKPFIILSVGRFIKEKNFPNMLRAFHKFNQKYPNSIYLIAGNGPLKNYLIELSEKLGIIQKVKFLGFLPHESLRILYWVSDVLLFVSIVEGQPRTAVEALATGLPVITHNKGQVTEIINEENGYIVSPYSIREITEALEKIFNKRGKFQESRERIFSTTIKKFNFNIVLRKEMEFYLKCLES